MASDRVQFERAMNYWEELHLEGAYSVPLSIGKTAIIVSFDQTYSTGESEKKTFTEEAYVLACTEREFGRESEVVIDAKGSDIARILQDPYFVNVVTIGHGSLSYLYINNNMAQSSSNRYDWRDVSADADHLKSGFFVQRHCGHAVRKLSVPLGVFAMSAHNHVLASGNEAFMPTDMPRSIISQLTMLAISERLSYEEVKRTFPYTQKP